MHFFCGRNKNKNECVGAKKTVSDATECAKKVKNKNHSINVFA